MHLSALLLIVENGVKVLLLPRMLSALVHSWEQAVAFSYGSSASNHTTAPQATRPAKYPTYDLLIDWPAPWQSMRATVHFFLLSGID
jgi:hypothetical protein